MSLFDNDDFDAQFSRMHDSVEKNMKRGFKLAMVGALRVMAAVACDKIIGGNEDAAIAAVLHDVVEDCDVGDRRLDCQQHRRAGRALLHRVCHPQFDGSLWCPMKDRTHFLILLAVYTLVGLGLVALHIAWGG